ncbi:MAG: hypothetical protein ACXWPM_02260, partial [Bdellovibrionota bacterium]
MKKIIVLLGLFCILFLRTSGAQASLPVSSVTSFIFHLYGLYTTSDATCQTGWVATIPITATPTAVDFATAPTIGTGKISTTVNCILFIAQNQFSYAWTGGGYSTSSTPFGGGTPNADSACNTAGTSGNQPVMSGSSLAPVWPPSTALVMTDMAAKGVIPTTTAIGIATQNEVIPIFLSVDSSCSMSPSDTA